MAKKNISESVNHETINADLPDGFESARPDMAGAYFRFAEGSTLRGMLQGRFEKPGSDGGFIYQVKATAPCTAFVKNPTPTGDDDKYVIEDVEPGTVVSIDEKASLKGLKLLAADDTCEWEIFVRVIERKKLDGGRTFWDCVVGKKAHKLGGISF